MESKEENISEVKTELTKVMSDILNVTPPSALQMM